MVNLMGRAASDEYYVLDLCDQVLAETGLHQGEARDLMSTTPPELEVLAAAALSRIIPSATRVILDVVGAFRPGEEAP